MKVFESKFLEEELFSVKEMLKEGQLGFGPNVLELEAQFQSFSNKKYNISTNSASASAFMIFAYLKEKYGVCDVYTPSLAFTSPAWAAKHFQHNIIWVDVNKNLLFDCKDYQRKRTSKNKTVVMPILYGGVSAINEWNLVGDEIVVVDSAHCATPTIKSDFTFFSFHPYKPICSSDGGMISTDDQEASEWLQAYKNFGRKNIGNSYDIIQNGFKFYMNNLNATIALISIKKYKNLLNQRRLNFKSFRSETGIFGELLFASKILPHDENSSYYFATVIADNNNLESIKKQYPTQTHYPLLHKTEYFNSKTRLPNSELLYNKIINLPLCYGNIPST